MPRCFPLLRRAGAGPLGRWVIGLLNVHRPPPTAHLPPPGLGSAGRVPRCQEEHTQVPRAVKVPCHVKATTNKGSIQSASQPTPSTHHPLTCYSPTYQQPAFTVPVWKLRSDPI